MFRNIYAVAMFLMPYAFDNSAPQGSDRQTVTRAQQEHTPDKMDARALFMADLEAASNSNNVGYVQHVCDQHHGIFAAMKAAPDENFKDLCDQMVCSAATRNNMNMLRALIALGINTTKYSALHDMVYKGNLEMVGLLLDAGANINLRSAQGSMRQPIHEAMGSNMIQLLYDTGANLDAQDKNGDTLMLDIIKDRRSYGKHPVVYQSLNTLCRLGANVNLGDDAGRTPLHLATISNLSYPERVRLLLAHGANPDACNTLGAKPFHGASSPGRPYYQENNRAVLRLLHAHQSDSDL